MNSFSYFLLFWNLVKFVFHFVISSTQNKGTSLICFCLKHWFKLFSTSRRNYSKTLSKLLKITQEHCLKNNKITIFKSLTIIIDIRLLRYKPFRLPYIVNGCKIRGWCIRKPTFGLLPCSLCKECLFIQVFFIRDNTAMGMGSETIEWKIELLTVLCICFSSITVGKFELNFFFIVDHLYIFTLANVFPYNTNLLSFLHNIRLGQEGKVAHE